MAHCLGASPSATSPRIGARLAQKTSRTMSLAGHRPGGSLGMEHLSRNETRRTVRRRADRQTPAGQASRKARIAVAAHEHHPHGRLLASGLDRAVGSGQQPPEGGAATGRRVKGQRPTGATHDPQDGRDALITRFMITSRTCVASARTGGRPSARWYPRIAPRRCPANPEAEWPSNFRSQAQPLQLGTPNFRSRRVRSGVATHGVPLPNSLCGLTFAGAVRGRTTSGMANAQP